MTEMPVLAPAELLTTLTARGVRLELAAGRLRYQAPPGVLTPELRDLLAGHRGEVIDLLVQRRACGTCGSAGPCQACVSLPDGWACRAALEAGLIRSNGERARPRAIEGPGWSAGAVIPCPACGNRPYSVPAPAFPWRRCDGPRGCGHTWDPEVGEAGPEGARTDLLAVGAAR